MHTWENPEIYTIRTVNQASQNDCRKETQMKCPINLIQTATRARLRDFPSESAACLSTRSVLFSSYLLHYFPSLWKFSFAKARALVTDHWSNG